MKTNAIDTENLIKVGNAVLNQKAIAKIEQFQDNDNDHLDERIKQNCRIMQFLAKSIYLYNDEDKTVLMTHLETLACEIDDYEALKKL